MTTQERADKAIDLKRNSCYNCCQAVSCVLADQTDLDDETLRQLSAGFCGGMGTLEATCGALIGAGIIAGLKTEGNGSVQYTSELLKKFAAKCGATKCGDLKAVTNGRPLCPCEDCIRNAVLVYGEVMGLE